MAPSSRDSPWLCAMLCRGRASPASPSHPCSAVCCCVIAFWRCCSKGLLLVSFVRSYGTLVSPVFEFRGVFGCTQRPGLGALPPPPTTTTQCKNTRVSTFPIQIQISNGGVISRDKSLACPERVLIAVTVKDSLWLSGHEDSGESANERDRHHLNTPGFLPDTMVFPRSAQGH